MAPPDTQTSRITRSSSTRAVGSYSYRIEVADGDACYGERAELGQDNPVRTPGSSFGSRLFNEGDDRYISWQVYLPTAFDAEVKRWQVIAQWKQRGGLGTPALSMDVEHGEFRLYKSDSNHDSSNSVLLWSAPVAKNRWVKFTLHVKFSPRPSVGFVELWGDPARAGSIVPLLSKTPTYTMKVATGADGLERTVPSHSRIGIYRDSAIQGQAAAYYDGYTVATTREVAESNAFGEGVVAPDIPKSQPNPTGIPESQPAPQSPLNQPSPTGIPESQPNPAPHSSLSQPTPTRTPKSQPNPRRKSADRPGRCAKLKGKKRAKCVRKRCDKLKGRRKKPCSRRVIRARLRSARALLPKVLYSFPWPLAALAPHRFGR